MSKDNITESVNTWDNFYQSRVCNDSYVNVFCEKLKRTVAAALRPYESDEVDIPSDCPLV